MKRVLCLSLVLTILCALLTFTPAAAATIVDSGECGYDYDNYKPTDDASYILYSDGNLVVSGTGALERYAFPAELRSNIKYATINNGITNISGSFSGCTALEKVIIPDSVTDMSTAFAGCTSLTDVKIPDNVTDMDGAFIGCSSLVEITIPANITSIQLAGFVGVGSYSSSAPYCQSFSGCKKLEKITVSSENNNFKSVNGVLFTKDGKTLIQYPAGKKQGTYIIPSGTTSIANAAFDDCVNLKQITLNEGIEDMGFGAFAGCSGLEQMIFPRSMTYIPCGFNNCINLKKIYIPLSVTQLGNNVLQSIFPNDTTNLTDVYYEGSKQDWDNMKLLYMGGGLSNATIHYNSPMPSEAAPTATAKPNAPSVEITHVSNERVSAKINNCKSSGAKVILAVYSKSGALIDMQETNVSDEVYFLSDNLRNSNIKVMLWNNMNDIKPLAETDETFAGTDETDL